MSELKSNTEPFFLRSKPREQAKEYSVFFWKTKHVSCIHISICSDAIQVFFFNKKGIRFVFSLIKSSKQSATDERIRPQLNPIHGTHHPKKQIKAYSTCIKLRQWFALAWQQTIASSLILKMTVYEVVLVWRKLSAFHQAMSIMSKERSLFWTWHACPPFDSTHPAWCRGGQPN